MRNFVRTRHQRRVFAVIESLEGPASVLPELAIPQASRFLDGLVVFAEPSEAWGPVRSFLAHRLVVVEHFSRPPSLAKIGWSRAKQAWVSAAWRQPGQEDQALLAPLRAIGRDRSPLRPPALLVLSSGRPRRALAALSELGVIEMIPGVWHARRPYFGDLLLVDPRGLSEELPGTSVLRLLDTPRSALEAGARISALLADPGVLESTKNRLLEQLMNRNIPTTDEEHTSIVDRLIQEGRRLGREEGREEGRRATLLRLAERRLGGAVARELAGIEDVERLEERILALLEAK